MRMAKYLSRHRNKLQKENKALREKIKEREHGGRHGR